MSRRSRYPGYDVLAKHDGVSWNEATRRTIDRRLAMRQEPRSFSPSQWRVLCAVCERIIPQEGVRTPVPLAGMLDARIAAGRTDGYRRVGLPAFGDAWRRGLDALEAEAQARHHDHFDALPIAAQVELLERMQRGELVGEVWRGMSSREFFLHRLLLDIASSYYAHPQAWNELGFGGPASPRGYVRLDFDRRDPWEAIEAAAGHEHEAREANRRVR
ncbi:MAG: gluconate 2-dehydrogenase subunit 3 family protein [Steroidobacteraceae bacterium]